MLTLFYSLEPGAREPFGLGGLAAIRYRCRYLRLLQVWSQKDVTLRLVEVEGCQCRLVPYQSQWLYIYIHCFSTIEVRDDGLSD